jgi:serine/threonine protein kinase/Flp pilus assembly protein TadD
VIGSTLAHYRITARLGSGGMGEVYRAEDTRLGRDVAIKILPTAAQADPERRARFMTEARAASALRSPHIATIYDIGEQDGVVYLAMEYVDGETLSARVARGPLVLAEGLDVASQVADALTEAHERGIVHRDIKSANVMITSRGVAKVLDFGLAKFVEGDPRADLAAAATFEHTMAGMVLGTVYYMSPEQALGRPLDARTDLFSLGVVLYEMLTGRLPFEGGSFSEIIDAIVNQPPPAPARFNYALTPEVEAMLRKALEKNAQYRYQSARDFYIDLRNAKIAVEEEARHRTSGFRRSSGQRAQAEVQQRSIAVITFTNITREPSDEWIGSGIAETVSSDLKSIHGLTVIGRERIFDALRNLQTGEAQAVDDRFAIEIGRGLGARWIVAGGYQRFGTEIRITARFVEVATGVVLRNVKIDGPLADIFRLQDRIVFELTQGLQVELAGSEIADIEKPETRSVEAYELFSLGVLTLRLASRDAPDRAISLFEKALALDPEYAQAWAGLGGAYQLKGTFLNLPELLEKAIECEGRALSLDPDLADAHTWRGAALLSLGRVDEATASLQRATELEPGQARPWSMLARAHWIGRGDLAGGIAALEKAVVINPQFGYGHLQLAFLYTEQGDYPRAQAAATRAVDLQERYISGEEGLLVVGAHTRLGYVHYREGRYADAVTEYLRELAFLAPSDHVLKDRTLIELHEKLGAAYLRLGQATEAERHLSLAIRSFEDRLARGADDAATKYYASIALALRGDTDRAVRYLEETWPRAGALNRLRVARDPDLESVRPALEAKGLLG